MLKVYSGDSPIAVVVAAHGAGAGQASSFMVRTATGLAHRGLTAATFDFPYMATGRRVPDKPDVLERVWRDAIDEARTAFPDLPLVIGGKSMGGRIASQVAASDSTGLSGLVFLGYPLHPPGKPQQRRDAHLPAIAAPMLFVQGTRDAFGTAAEIEQLLPRLGRATLNAVEGGDHSFKVSGRGAPRPDEVLSGILDAVSAWIRGLLNREAPAKPPGSA